MSGAETVVVTQADREAAERWGTGPVYNMQHLAEAFARHRIATQADALAVMREALGEYDEPMSALTAAERGEVLADNLRAAIARQIEGE
jgi:hypothetical protein